MLCFEVTADGFSKDKSTFGSKTGNDNFRLDGIQKHETSEAH